MTVSLPPPLERTRAEAPPWEPASHAACGRTAPIAFDADTWLEADGRGGYACLRRDGGASGHPGEGLFVVPHGPQRTVYVLVSALDERVALATPDACHGWPPHEERCAPAVAPTCTGFEATTHPTWTLGLHTAGVEVLTLRREVLQPRGRHATLVRWTLLEGDAATLHLRPRLPYRAAHARAERDRRALPGAVNVGGGVLVRPYPGLPALRFGADRALDFRPAPRWVSDARGAGEDPLSPGEFCVTLTRGVPFTLELALSHSASPSPEAAFRREVARRERAACSERAAERFLAHTAEGRATVLSGWPGDGCAAQRGADAFSALPGLTFARGAHEVGLRVLVDALPFLDVGLMPERFGVDAETSEYGSEAPGLWFAWAARRAVAAVPNERSELGDGEPFAAPLREISERFAGPLLAIAERFASGLELIEEAPSDARLVELALGADLAGHLALAGGRQSRRWARVRRSASQRFRAHVAATTPLRPRLIAAMLEHSPLDRASRRALVAEVAEHLELESTAGLGPEELAWFAEAALRIAPATRPRLAALAESWHLRGQEHPAGGALAVAARLAARACLEGAPR